MNISSVYNQKVVSCEQELFSQGLEDQEFTFKSKVIFLFLSIIPTLCVFFSIKFLLDRFDIMIIRGEVSFNTHKELSKVFHFLRQNTKRIQNLDATAHSKKEGAIRDLITDFFQTFGPMSKNTETFVNSTLMECKFKKSFEYCRAIGVRKPEIVITYMFTCLAKDFMQKVINNSNSHEDDQEGAYARAIEKAINGIEREVAVLNYLFAIDKTRIQHYMR